MSLNKIISMVFLLLCLAEVSSYAAAKGPSTEMDEEAVAGGGRAAGGGSAASVSRAPLPHPDHLLTNETRFGKWISLETGDLLEARGLSETGYSGFAAEMQGGDLAQYQNLPPYGDFFGGMMRRPQGLEGSGIEDSLLGLLGSVPEGHSVQILGYPLLWKPVPTLSYVVIHRESTERDTELSLEDLTEVFHRDQITSFIGALIGIKDPAGRDPSILIDRLNRFGKISLADCLSTLPIFSRNKPGFARDFMVEYLYKEGATSPAAQMRLGDFYGRQNKKVLARQYYKQVADQGYAPAQNNFAEMCYYGDGGDEDLPMARQYFQLASDQGHGRAQYAFAEMCYYGDGGDEDFPMARQYFQLVADQGCVTAQYDFAEMCRSGLGGEEDLPTARQYYQLAADQGDDLAQEDLSALLKQMSDQAEAGPNQGGDQDNRSSKRRRVDD